ncbi:MAG: PilN domain-containing protein [Legionella sp.]
MTEINLLPWREKLREQEKKWFTALLLTGIVAAAVLVFFINYYAGHLVDNQMIRNQMLQKQITELDKQIIEIRDLKERRAALISRMLIIRNLQATRVLMVHLFDELIKIIPSGIYVTKLERKDDIITIWGFAESNTNVSILMNNIEHDVWIQNPALTEIKRADEKKQAANNEFSLSFILKPKY